MTKRKTYYATLDRNGTEDEYVIRTPNGRQLAFIWFWDEPKSDDAANAQADAKLIVDALMHFARPNRGDQARSPPDNRIDVDRPQALTCNATSKESDV